MIFFLNNLLEFNSYLCLEQIYQKLFLNLLKIVLIHLCIRNYIIKRCRNKSQDKLKIKKQLIKSNKIKKLKNLIINPEIKHHIKIILKEQKQKIKNRIKQSKVLLCIRIKKILILIQSKHKWHSLLDRCMDLIYLEISLKTT